jgi:hypothetical protein
MDHLNEKAGILDARSLYKTAMKAEDYVTRCRLLAWYHGNRLLGRPGHDVEVFSEMKKPISSHHPMDLEMCS